MAAASIIDELKEHHNPKRADQVRNYMKTSNLEFLGVPLSTTRAIAKKHAKTVDSMDYTKVLVELWMPRVFDVRRAAAEVLLQFQKRGMKESHIISLVDAWIDDIDTWTDALPSASITGCSERRMLQICEEMIGSAFTSVRYFSATIA